MIIRRLSVVVFAAALSACSGSGSESSKPNSAAPAPQNTADRKYLLERVDEAAVVQVYADDFASLPLKDKTLIYHLTQAAIAGRDIYYDQRYAHGLEMREVIEGILTHASGVKPDTLSEIQRYAKLFWLNSSPYNNLTTQKFVLKCTPEAFAEAAKSATSAGATFPFTGGETLDGMPLKSSHWNSGACTP